MSAAGDVCDVVYSLAEEQDFQQVLNICSSDAFDGLDYMAVTFHRWLQEPGRLVFLARMNDRVVALESALLVDGGQTAVFQGLRVVPDLRGRGIAGALQKHVTDYLHRHYPQVSAVRLSRGVQPPTQTLSKYRLVAKEVTQKNLTVHFLLSSKQQLENMTEQLNKQMFTSGAERLNRQQFSSSSDHAIVSLCCEAVHLRAFVAELRTRLQSQAQSHSYHTVTLNQQQVETLILTDHVVSNLLPGKTIINDWEPLKPMEPNLEVLRRRGLTWIVDRELEPSAVSLCTTPYPVPYRHDAVHFNINIFSRSAASVCSVFLAQLEALLPSLNGYLIFHTYVDPEVWPGLHQFCQNKANVCFFKDYWEEVILEMDL